MVQPHKIVKFPQIVDIPTKNGVLWCVRLGEPVCLRGVEFRRLPRAPVKLGLNKLGLKLEHVEFSKPNQTHAHSVG